MYFTLYFFWLKKSSLAIGLGILILCSTKLCLAQETKKGTEQLFNQDLQDASIYLAVAANFKSTLQLLVNSFLLQQPNINKRKHLLTSYVNYFHNIEL